MKHACVCVCVCVCVWNHQVRQSPDYHNKEQTSNVKTELGTVQKIQM